MILDWKKLATFKICPICGEKRFFVMISYDEDKIVRNVNVGCESCNYRNSFSLPYTLRDFQKKINRG